MEVWKDIPGYEGIYEASNTGKIRTCRDKTTHSVRHGIRKWEQRELKQKVSKDDCHRVCLWKEKKDKTWLVHRLVALTFLRKPNGKDYINHIDGDRHNNHVSNLEWCDHRENNNHAFDNGLMTSNQEIILMDKENAETHYFRSMAKASEFLGYKKTFLSAFLKKGKKEVKGFKIFKTI
ncbi:NUMOD4 motif-containing HNH endonuclease [Alkalihalophilus marmarensis]|uniref:NUMOD4 domain-containing protein n=1 Tax=Alkalihalophilus marmarensis TaxID=521377 RepID=UPI00203C93ED|nr:NUMOD4 domain-containing protein [Alkalihalophilus marmarensis]MCM3488805.1 NUMOD4 motif-containing HNH endonuclease [Alkalihalophilus marmarensis]